MKTNRYKESLMKVYEKHFCSNECPHHSRCGAGLINDGLFFNRAKLGKKYGDGEYRKVLIIGKEPVSENREITYTASLEEANNPHYRRTLYTLALILDKEPKSDAMCDLMDYEELLDYICLTNYFKCSFTETDKKSAKKNSNKKTSKAMREGCWPILIDEIEALKPEIIVIQGTSYSKGFWEEIKKRYGDNCLPEANNKTGYEELTKHMYADGEPFYIVWAYHPTAKAEYSWKKRLNNLRTVVEKLKNTLA